MIGELSSFIELFAAVYLTISLDDLLLKRFWTPDYKNKMEESFKQIKMPELAKKQSLKNTEGISALEETRSRKRGIILFCFSVSLLILIGLESGLSIKGKNYESVGIVLAAFLYLCVFTFDGFCLKTGWRVLIFGLSVPVLAILCLVLLGRKVEMSAYLDSSSDVWFTYAKIIIILTLVTPVLWQLFRNWIYTRYYLLYVVEQTTMKAEEYDYAVNFNTQKGDKMTMVAKPYMDHVAISISQNDQDRDITPLLSTFLNELANVNYIPSIIPLMKSSFLMHKKYFPSKWRLRRLQTKYDSLGKSSKKPSLELFCKENGVSLSLFKEYRKGEE